MWWKEAGTTELLEKDQASVPDPHPAPRTTRAGPAIVQGRQKGFIANIILLAEIHQVGGSLTGIESSKPPSALTGTDSRTAGTMGP